MQMFNCFYMLWDMTIYEYSFDTEVIISRGQLHKKFRLVLKVSHLILFFKTGQKLKHRLVQTESKI